MRKKIKLIVFTLLIVLFVSGCTASHIDTSVFDGMNIAISAYNAGMQSVHKFNK